MSDVIDLYADSVEQGLKYAKLCDELQKENFKLRRDLQKAVHAMMLSGHPQFYGLLKELEGG